ncbi:complex I subunit 4 family protein [Methylocucumis oryzae]|uniref:NADH-quinone oxidoreductase subunit M n=1 Tax=Methylocucumis oryzae TaxID=1632867 RepID=A0A0F3IJP4_9GAMM|nr:NADH-quinone oxidoreductase subunit M [Methylocucumis oryzae]KJV06892.1 oxidoreductase [Methylocucumis oryzae]
MRILSLLLWTPAVGALLLVFFPSHQVRGIRWLANGFGLLSLLLACYLLSLFKPSDAGLQFSEFFPLNPNLGSAYALGVDGLSMPMLMLSALLTSVSLLASFSINSAVKGYYLCILLLEFGVTGVFMAQDWALFYIFWEVTLIPLFFLIGRWGGKRRHAASLNFVLYTMVGSVFMLLSLLAVSQYDLHHAGSLMTSMHQAAQDMPLYEQILVLAGFILGFGVKLPIFPMHGWLPLAHVEAPAQVSVLLSGILLKMGAYGLIRAAVMLPEATHILQPLLIFLALFGMLYGGLLAWRQTNLKGMVAYSSISHMGLVLFGIASLNEAGLNGAIQQMTAHGLVSGALFLLLGLLYLRSHTMSIQEYGNLLPIMPRFACMMILALFAGMGLPGFAGFIPELHTLISCLQTWPWLIVFFGIAILISAAYLLRTLTRLFTGPNPAKLVDANDLQSHELLASGVLIASIILLGLMPSRWIELSAGTAANFQHIINQRIAQK